MTSAPSRSTRSARPAGNPGPGAARAQGRRPAMAARPRPAAGRPARPPRPARPCRRGILVRYGGRDMAPDLRTRLGNVELPNPILTASGCASSGRELAQFIDVSKIGAIVTKSVMLAPRAGRPTPRMAETSSGMLNSIGLQGPGIDAFLQRDLPWLLSPRARAVVSIAGHTVGGHAELAARLSEPAGATAREGYLPCPHAEHRGQVF